MFITKYFTKIIFNIKNYHSSYEVFGIFLAILFSFLGHCESKKATKINRDILEIQKKEFYIRNRPYVILEGPRFGGACVHYNDNYPRSVLINLRNVSDVPALNVKFDITVYLDDEIVNHIPRKDESSTIAKDSVLGLPVGIKEEWYNSAIKGTKLLVVKYILKYPGVLEDKQIYESTLTAVYNHSIGYFGSQEINIK